ncbi:hypothetical protein AMS68_004580 [Peltaster fructicola]|uniref:Ubiquitin carboxyl-terminal hydrolase n=1 Tax=Peltaster fructicola TaxID=286661 RepID=A0A6H0XWD7_9PEZI|nr:hypothetical protein AMS68_004580 [Peltaster fructicola]
MYYQPPPQYYHPQMQPYTQQRWQPQHPVQYQQHYMPQPMQHMPYPQRSPMIAPPQPMTPSQRPQGTRQYSQQSMPHMQQYSNQTPQSSSPIPTTPSAFPSLTNTTQIGLPSPVPTPERDIVSAKAQDETHESMESQEVNREELALSEEREQSSNPLQLPAERRTPYYPKLPCAMAIEAPSLSSTSAVQRAVEDVPSDASTVAAPSDLETPATSHAPSESEYTQVSTPTTPALPTEPSPKPTPTQAQQHIRRDTRSAVAIPIIPNLPRHKGTPSLDRQTQTVTAAAQPEETIRDESAQESVVSEEQITLPAAPKSWADLVRIRGTAARPAAAPHEVLNGVASLPKNATLAEALRQYVVQSSQISFFEPRGLVNTGNMCYMNSILQVLVFCVPFFNFLDQVRTRTVHSMKSETPLLDAMIMFMRELKVLASAGDLDSLRKTLKPEQLEKYGDPITPEYIYDALKHLPRFQSMRRGHQQDAEEFLGFVLEGLHDECVAVMQGDNQALQADQSDVESQQEGDGWLEVGPKQKAAVTRTAGHQDAPSPVTKIFGGHLRSELRVPGQKDSVTLEPYKPLQLDIGASHINNIVDALKGITHIENLTGDFGGRGNTAKKQVFIDSLPPVLILHLKRFQYENNLTGTQKIWKKVGYPLELEIPKEVFTQSKRGSLSVSNGLPKYRLTAVVYHHGKSAAGGHYTVDVLRQDFREWVRIDDTFIRRIRPEDVAEGGAAEDPKILARALEQHKADQEMQKQRNMYQGLDEEEQTKPWSEVNGHAEKKKPGNGAVPAGVATPSSTTGKRTPTTKREGVKDNKVAYILLYERIEA